MSVLPVNQSVKQCTPESIVPSKDILFLGPHAEGPSGMCVSRVDVVEQADGSCVKGSNGHIYSQLSPACPGYLIRREELYRTAHGPYDIYGLHETREIDGKIVVKTTPLPNDGAMKAFLASRHRTLDDPRALAEECEVAVYPQTHHHDEAVAPECYSRQELLQYLLDHQGHQLGDRRVAVALLPRPHRWLDEESIALLSEPGTRKVEIRATMQAIQLVPANAPSTVLSDVQVYTLKAPRQ